ncbi:MAG: hypothetical protein JWM09_1378 [Francisellaceae bacterium]|nr:hypothetical protein [Francisellaceae bacterium]
MSMKPLNLIAFILALIGAINWGLVGLSNFNLVTQLFGVGSHVTKIIYLLVGASGLYLLIDLLILKYNRN